MAIKLSNARLDESSDLEESQATQSANPSAWRPLWLRKLVLLAFAALFILLAISLGIIKYFVAQRNGLSLSFTDNHYLLTYGPTMLLTCVVSLWRRVNCCSMVSQPWHDLSSSSPQDAAKTVLLDYLWPLQFSSFIKS